MKVCKYPDPVTGEVCGREVDKLVKGVCLRCYNRDFRPLINCSECGKATQKHKKQHCHECFYAKKLYGPKPCSGCGKTRKAAYKGGFCVTCYVNHIQPEQVCSGCGQMKKLTKGSFCKRCEERDLKHRAFAVLGGRCACCYEHDPNLLTVDHVNNDGAEHRRELVGNHSRIIYREILKSSGPITRYQLLCWCCNSGRQIASGGICHDHYRRQQLRSLNDSTRPLNP